MQIPVWFEGSADDPQIAVALPTIAKSDQSDPRIAAVRTPRVQYPPRMLGVEGKVRVLTLVSPSGDVISANVLSGTALGAFDSVAQRSAGGISIKWTEPAPDKPICMLKTYLFCMESAARTRLPFAECRKW